MSFIISNINPDIMHYDDQILLRIGIRVNNSEIIIHFFPFRLTRYAVLYIGQYIILHYSF